MYVVSEDGGSGNSENAVIYSLTLLPHIKIAMQNFKLLKQGSPCRSIWLIKGTIFKNIHD